jgi:hypothetical protein
MRSLAPNHTHHTDTYGRYVVGLDFSGNPTKSCFADFRAAFELARQAGLRYVGARAAKHDTSPTPACVRSVLACVFVGVCVCVFVCVCVCLCNLCLCVPSPPHAHKHLLFCLT